MTERYGFPFVFVYLGLYWATLGGLYGVIRGGLASADEILHAITVAVEWVGGTLGIPQLGERLHLTSISPEAAPVRPPPAHLHFAAQYNERMLLVLSTAGAGGVGTSKAYRAAALGDVDRAHAICCEVCFALAHKAWR